MRKNFSKKEGPEDREGERAFAKAEVVSITVTGKAGAAAPVTTNVTIQPGKENGADASASGAVVTTDNKVAINFNLKTPEWVPAGATADIKYDVKVNGNTMASKTGTTGAAANGYTSLAVADALTASSTAISTGSKVDIVITEIKWSKVKVEYQKADGTEIAASALDAPTASLTVASAEAVSVCFKSTDGTATAVKASVYEGATAAAAEKAMAWDSVNGWYGSATLWTAGELTVAGDGPVIIRISGIDGLKEKLAVTFASAVEDLGTAAGVAVKTLGASVSDNDKLRITSSDDLAAVEAGGTVTLNAQLAAAKNADAAAVYGYLVTVKNGSESHTTAVPVTANSPVEIGTFTVNSNWEIGQADVTITEVMVVDFQSVSVSANGTVGGTVTITMNRPVSESKVKAATIAFGAANAPTLVAGSVAVNGSVITLRYEGEITDGTTTLTFTSGAALEDAEYSANAAANKTITFDSSDPAGGTFA